MRKPGREVFLSSPSPDTSDTADGQTGSPLSAGTVHALKISIIIMTVLIAGGLVALVYGMSQQMNKLSDKPPVAKTVSVSLGAGTILHAIEAADEAGSLWLHVELNDGRQELLLVNPKGQLVRTVRLDQTQ